MSVVYREEGAPAPISANRVEMVHVSEALAREKGIEREIVIQAIAEAMVRAARALYGAEQDLRAEVDEKACEIRLFRRREVVEALETPAREIVLADALVRHPEVKMGDVVEDRLPDLAPSEFGRIAAQAARQVIVQKVREAERARQYEEYKSRVGDIVNGVVRRVDYGNVTVDLGQGEGVARREELLVREKFREGDRIQAYIYQVEENARGPQIFLSRARPEFMAKLFAREVPEIYDGVVEIVNIARDPGSRAKVAVSSRDASIDPVGACVGLRGSRVQAVVNELQGEKIDIVPHTPDIGGFVANALSSSTVSKVILHEDEGRAEVVVPEEFLSQAIGRRGQNVRLAGQLVGWNLDILTEEQESIRRQKEFKDRTELLMGALEVEETRAQSIVSEGYERVEDIAWQDAEEFALTPGLDEELAATLQARANAWVVARDTALDEERRRLGVEDSLAELAQMSLPVLVALGKARVRTLSGLADLATDDLTGWNEVVQGQRTRQPGILDGLGVSRTEAEALVMEARVATGVVDAQALVVPEEETEAPDDGGIWRTAPLAEDAPEETAAAEETAEGAPEETAAVEDAPEA